MSSKKLKPLRPPVKNRQFKKRFRDIWNSPIGEDLIAAIAKANPHLTKRKRNNA